MEQATTVKSNPMEGMYDTSLPNMHPFQWVEDHAVIEMKSGEAFAVLSFGAYNVGGGICPEMGGVAVCLEQPQKFVIATRTIHYDMAKRKHFFEMLRDDIATLIALKEMAGVRECRNALVDMLASRGMDVRG